MDTEERVFLNAASYINNRVFRQRCYAMMIAIYIIYYYDKYASLYKL